MLGLALRVLLAAAAVATVAAVVIYVSGKITRSKLQEKLRDQGMKDSLIYRIDRCNNIVNLKNMDSDQEIEIHGDDVDYELNEGERIYV